MVFGRAAHLDSWRRRRREPRTEDTIVVTDDGCRSLMRTAFDVRLLLGGRPVRRHDAQSAAGGPNARAAASDAVLPTS